MSVYAFDHSATDFQPGPIAAAQIEKMPVEHALGFLLGTVTAVLAELERPDQYPAQCPERYVKRLRDALDNYDRAKCVQFGLTMPERLKTRGNGIHASEAA